MSGSVVDDLAFDPDGGSINYKDIRYFLIRSETFAELYRQVSEQCGDACREIFFQAGYRGVSLSMQSYSRAGMLPSGEELLAYMADMAGQVGWGKVSSISLDQQRREIVLEFQNSVLARHHDDAKHPVCDSIRGAFSAIGEALWSERVSAEEVMCTAMGHDRCRFVIAARNP